MKSMVKTGFLFLIFLLTIFSNAQNDPSMQYTKAEEDWLSENIHVTIALDAGNPPLNFIRDDGHYTGISVDYVNLIANKAGFQVHYEGSTWNEALEKAKSYEVDGIMSASYTKERLQWFNFSKPYTETPLAVAVRNDFKTINTISDLNGSSFAIIKGTVRVEVVRNECPDSKITEVNTIDEGIKLLSEGKVDAFFDDLPVIVHLMESEFITNIKVALLYFYPKAGEQRLAIRKDKPELVSIINKAIDAITRKERNIILKRWMGNTVNAPVQYGLILNEKERSWLNHHRVIRVASDISTPPIESFNQKGEYEGIAIEHLTEIAKIIGVKLEYSNGEDWHQLIENIQNKEVDIFSAIAPISRRDSYMNYTDSFFELEVVIFSLNEKGYIHNLENLNGKTVTGIKGYSSTELIKSHYPQINIIETTNTKEGIDKVISGKAEGYIGAMLPTSYYLIKNGIYSLRVSGKTPWSFPLTIGVRKDWPELVSIINKAMKTIPDEKKDEIRNNWQGINLQPKTDFSLLWRLAGGFIILLLLSLFWNNKLINEVKQRQRVETDLLTYKEQLENLVKQRTLDLEKSLEKQKLLAMAIEQTAESVVIFKQSGAIQYINPAYEKFNNTTMEEELGNTPWFLNRVANNPETCDEIWQAILKLEKWQGIIINNTPQRKTIEMESIITPIFGVDKELSYIAVNRDITEQKKLETKFRESQKMESIGTLAGGIAHDFNNILGGIIGFTDLSLFETSPETHLYHNLEQIMSAALRAKDLVQQILIFCRKTDQKKGYVNIRPLLKELVKFISATIPTSIKTELTLECGEETIYADPSQIHQVLMNLCTNANHAMKKTGGELHISASNINITRNEENLPNGKYLLISIKDTGYGIEKENLDKIFDPYFTTKEVGEGTGLGLAVVHGIIIDHKGTITVKSEIGHGTEFIIYLPVVEVQEPTTAKEPVKEVIIDHKEGNIYIIDDEEMLTNISRNWLVAIGYNVKTFYSPEEALEEFKDNPTGVDLIVTDKTMPKVSGLELAEQVKNIRQDIPILMCSGFWEEADIIKINSLGLNMLDKPLRRNEFLDTVNQLLT